MSDSEEDENFAPFRPDIEKIQRKLAALPTIESLMDEKDPHALTDSELELGKKMVLDLIAMNPTSEQELKIALKKQRVAFKTDNKKSLLGQAYRALRTANEVPKHDYVEQYLISKAPRSQSGVLVVTVFTSPYPVVDGVAQRFSCEWNCYYCPNEPNQPRSYLLNEPGVRRANQVGFDPVKQFNSRVDALVAIGHPADKVELMVLGGTWESYPDKYREGFIRDMFYAANVYFDSEPKRRPLDMLQEQMINEASSCKIIGVTLETRPDTINPEMLVRLRQFGCTRVQLGIQHTDDSILMAINRQSNRDDAVRAIRLLKDSCFKVDIHLMPDLPGTTPENDKKMFDDVLESEDLQADQWKIYPCQTTPFTVIHEWYEQGKYQPYGLDKLIDVILYTKRKVHPWIRINRVVRDIPVEYVLAGIEVSNLRQLLAIRMKQEGKTCQCIRCREVKGDHEVTEKLKTAQLVERQYLGSGGKEIFLSYETPDYQTIFGFLRLRLPPKEFVTPFNELKECALIRELHVYGNLAATTAKASAIGGGALKAQHTGIGSRLLERAEAIARNYGFRKIAVISGVGVRGYYKKRGYLLVEPHRGGYLIKELPNSVCTLTDQLKPFDNFLHQFLKPKLRQSNEQLGGVLMGSQKAFPRTFAVLQRNKEAQFRFLLLVVLCACFLYAIVFGGGV